MRIAKATLESISAYSQSKYYNVPKLEKEKAADYERRTWRERCHTTEDGNIFIPPMSIKNCLSEVAKYLSVKVEGKGKATYTKHFEAGILVMDGIILPEKKETVEGEWFFVPSDGRRGGGSRVEKCFPVIRHWKGEAVFYVLDETITEKVFEYHLAEAGNFIGLGRFRPRNNGFYGRFKALEIKWE